MLDGFDVRVLIVFAVGVYRDLIFLHIIINLILGFSQAGPPSWIRPVISFVHDACEPFLRLFRGILPGVRMGGMGFDLSPIIAFIVLYIVEVILQRVLLGPGF